MDILSAGIFLMGLLLVLLVLWRLSQPGSGFRREETATGILPTLYMYQLDPVSLRPGKRFELNDVVMEDDGYTISGPRGKKGMLLLSGSNSDAASYVSDEHAVVFKQEGSYYIQNYNGKNGMTLLNSSARVDEVEITDKIVVCLARQPIQFVFVDNIVHGDPDFSAEDDNQPVVRQRPVRRNPPIRRH